MKKNVNKLLVWTTGICLLPMIMSLVLYPKLPDRIAIHFNSAGVPDNYAPKAAAAFGIPLMMACLNVISHLALDSDPKRARTPAAMKFLGKWLVPVLTLALMPVTLLISLGVNIPIQTVVPVFVGIVLILCGNYLPKCKQNYTVGIKLPWTLNSEENWNKTHHLAGYLWILSGIIMCAAALLKWNWLPVTAFLIVLGVVVPSIYSYCLHQKGI